MAHPKAIRAEVMEFAAILEASALEPALPATDETLWLRIKARVLTEDGETVDYLGDPMPFHLAPKQEA